MLYYWKCFLIQVLAYTFLFIILSLWRDSCRFLCWLQPTYMDQTHVGQRKNPIGNEKDLFLGICVRSHPMVKFSPLFLQTHEWMIQNDSVTKCSAWIGSKNQGLQFSGDQGLGDVAHILAPPVTCSRILKVVLNLILIFSLIRFQPVQSDLGGC